MIAYGRQEIVDADIAAVAEVMRSDWLTQGPTVPQFEERVAEYCAAKYAVAVCNGTAGLHLACMAAGLRAGDILWTSPITFVASANCARFCGADVDFVDIEPGSLNMDTAALERKLEEASWRGSLPRIVVPVHFGGQPCDMTKIAELAKKFGFLVIEDASHALGAEYLGRKVGDGSYSDMTVFSFHPVKIITTGEGGMVTTNDPELRQRLEMLRTHGITRDPARLSNTQEGAWYYEQLELGYNYRITDIQAALGLSQLSRLDRFLARRRELAARYDRLLAGLPVRSQRPSRDGISSHHLYVVRLQMEGSNKTRRKVFDEMRAAGIGVNVHYIPVYRQPYYQQLGFREGYCPEAERYYSEAITLPLHPQLTDGEQDRVIEALRRTLGVLAA
jgi:UDP-4-amino-4,6-dideoxy-N-acetyl-beta-L-altrosamine transaminase